MNAPDVFQAKMLCNLAIYKRNETLRVVNRVQAEFGSDGQMLNALLIDDDRGTLGLLRYYYTKNGFQVEQRENGLLAFEDILHKDYSLVVTDHYMPVMSGGELIRKVRQFDRLTPFLLISNDASIEDVWVRNEFSPVSFLAKPLDMATLIAASRAVISKSERLIDRARQLAEKTAFLRNEQKRLLDELRAELASGAVTQALSPLPT